MTFGTPKTSKKNTSAKANIEKEPLKMNLLKNGRKTLTKPVIVPGITQTLSRKEPIEQANKIIKEESIQIPENSEIPQTENIDNYLQGSIEQNVADIVEPEKRGRGRPRKIKPEIAENVNVPKRGRGRPRKIEGQETVLPGFDEPEFTSNNINETYKEPEETMLPGFEEPEEIENKILPGFESEETEKTALPGFEEPVLNDISVPKNEISSLNTERNNNLNSNNNNSFVVPGFENGKISSNPEYKDNYENYAKNEIRQTQNNYGRRDISNLLTRDKKIVSFVGTSKNGTSFIVNNLAALISKMGMNVAILDMTQNRNSYYIYTKNEENLRKIAYQSMDNLQQGIANGINVSKNLTVYTSLPEEDIKNVNAISIMETLVQNYDLVLIDCDFETPIDIFEQVQEIYLVQSMDILTIQSLTAFLKELKVRDVLEQEKIKIVINKEMKIKGLTSKVLIGGMSSYNDPSMSFMTNLFNKDTVQYCTIPFEIPTYSKYLEGLVNCDISLNGYSKQFLTSLKNLAGMVYPLINNKYARKNDYSRNNKFSYNMNNTLEQMKNKF